MMKRGGESKKIERRAGPGRRCNHVVGKCEDCLAWIFLDIEFQKGHRGVFCKTENERG